jgi:large subunit ribosomal protein L1
VIHAGIGKASFSEGDLVENLRAFMDAITKAKPSGIKGTYMRKVSICSTMGPGIRLDLSSLSAA